MISFESYEQKQQAKTDECEQKFLDFCKALSELDESHKQILFNRCVKNTIFCTLLSTVKL